MGVRRNVTIRQSLQYVADHPTMRTDNVLEIHVHELVARTLFEIANGADVHNPRSMRKANLARDMIFKRLVGKRRAGSHPATKKLVTLDFVDLAAHQVGGSNE
jgi:hypothetical protein